MKSAETEEHVSGLEELGQEEIEELSFVPSAVSEPRWVLHMCDNKCREEGFKCFQLAAMSQKEEQLTRTTCARNVTTKGSIDKVNDQ